MFAGREKKLHGVEAVQLRGLRVRHIQNDHVEGVASRHQIGASVGVMDAHTWVRRDRGNLRGEEPPRHGDDRRVHFDVIDSFHGGVLQHLGDGALDPAADEENTPGRGVLQQRIVDRLFGGAWVRSIGEDCAVVVQAADVARDGDGQVAVDRVARTQQAEASPETGLRGSIERGRNPQQQGNRQRRPERNRNPAPLAAPAEQQQGCHAQIGNCHRHGDLEGIEKSQQHHAGQATAEGGTGGLQQVSRTGRTARRDVAFRFVHAHSGDEESTRDDAKQAQTCQRSNQHRRWSHQLTRHGLKDALAGAQCP